MSFNICLLCILKKNFSYGGPARFSSAVNSLESFLTNFEDIIEVIM